jgi:tetratricopeptide (TPR) repeat protein
LRESITRALAKVPADRFATAAEFGRVLRASVKAEGRTGGSDRGREKRIGPWVGIGLMGVAAVAAILLLQRRTNDEVPVSPGAAPTWTILAEVEGSAPEDIRDLVGRLLASAIDASGVLLTLPQDQIQRGLSAAFLPDTITLTRVVARELAERGRISTVLVPSLDRAGATFALDLRLVEAEKDSVMAATRVTAEHDDGLIPASSRVVDSLMVALADWAGAQTRPPRTDPPITASLDAFRKRVQAVTAYQNGDLGEAIALCRQALEIDPRFAEAWITLGNTFEVLGFPDSAQSAREQALKHPDRLSEHRAAWYAARLARDPVRQLQVMEQEYQRTGVPTNNLAISLGEMGRYPEAVEVFDRIAEQAVFGISPVVSSNWAGYLLAMGRVEEARAVAEGTRGSSRQQRTMILVAVRAGDWEEAERSGAEVASDPAMNEHYRSEALLAVASARAARGRVERAVSALSEMIRLNQEPGREPGRRQGLVSLLLLRMAAGLALDPPEVGSLESDSTALSRITSGLWSAELGDLARARAYRDELPLPEVGEFDSPTVEQALNAALHARIALLEGRRMDAARVLRPVTGERSPRVGGSTRIPEWVAAEAEERQGYLVPAAERFAQIAAGFRFSSGEIEAFGLTYSFAHRKAALLYGEGGREEEAMEHWQAFLEGFTQPDPEFEWMVEEARAELARLEG